MRMYLIGLAIVFAADVNTPAWSWRAPPVALLSVVALSAIGVDVTSICVWLGVSVAAVLAFRREVRRIGELVAGFVLAAAFAPLAGFLITIGKSGE